MPTRPTSASAVAASGGPARRRALCGFGVLAVLLHLALLGAVEGGGVGADRPRAAVAWVSARTIAAPAPSAAPAELARPPEPGADAATAPDPRPAPARPVVAARVEKASARSAGKPQPRSVQPSTAAAEVTPSTPPVEAAVAPEPAPVETGLAGATGTLAPFAVEVVPEPADAPALLKVALDTPRATVANLLAAGERPPPTYRTLLPAPAILRYELRRGILRGTGEIRWRPAGDRYALQFEARLAGLTLLAQSSQGELGAHGLAPVRFVDQRARKAARAVNFSRDSNTISFSGSSAQWPLFAGSQDRLSWMIQLGGIVAADPALASSGRISMVLVSARGEASVRNARFAGRENAETATGSVPTLKFVIDGHSAYDGSFEIWLDPARGYLPARAVSRGASGDAEFELLLQRADP